MTAASPGGPMGIYGFERRLQQPFAAGAWGGETFRPDAVNVVQAAPSVGATAGTGAMEAEDKLAHISMAPDAVVAAEESPRPPSSDSFGHDHDHDAGHPSNKAQRRLAQNREAARKSRQRKKAYIQTLETSRMKLAQMEQELARVRRQQSLYAGGSIGESTLGIAAPLDSGVAAFEMEYAHWVEEQSRQVGELRMALQSQAPEIQLRILVDAGLAHYDALFRAKSVAARSDAFFVMSGAWRSPAERLFLWIGGFRPSELLKILAPQLEPLDEEQASAVRVLQQTARQLEDALSQGMDKLQQTLVEALMTVDSPDDAGHAARHMAGALAKLGALPGFVEQADLIRQDTLGNMHKILTPRQAARGLLALGDYCQRLRALSSLWVARPHELP